MPHLFVVYGPPLSGKTSLARELARALGDKSAIVSTDALVDEAIVGHDHDAYAELEMVHTQARLLVANYLKNGYHTVLEGSFIFERDGVLHHHEQEIDQTLSLMRNLARLPLVVRVAANEETLRRRASASRQLRDVEAALRIEAAYRSRYGSRSMVLSTDDRSPAELAEEVVARLETGE